MKYISLFACAALLACLGVPSYAYTYYGGMLSPAMVNLAEEVTLVKSGLVSGDIVFSPQDFTKAVGGRVESVTVTALPSQSCGTLTFDSAPVAANQMISSESLGKLKFTPASGCTEASFRFKANGEYSMVCLLRYTDSVNSAPVIAQSVQTSAGNDDGIWTQRDISVFGALDAFDPEGDALKFEIVKYPENGILQLLNKERGDFKYTPCDGVVGEDSFTYTVCDEWGNYAGEAAVSVKIEKEAADLVFADMDEHWAHNAALVMAADRAMDFETRGSLVYFRPDEEISREDFLVTVMKALGAGDVPPAKTVFADDGDISENASGYTARAYELGIIKGRKENGELYFRPAESITRAEAAVILNSIIGASEPDTVPVFADNTAVPAWARGALYALSDAGIFTGTGSGYLSPNMHLSRAQTAQILLTVKKYTGNM